jgi:hypothetical protein
MKTLYTTKDGRTITLHWNSMLARVLCWWRGNEAITTGKRNIWVSSEWITAYQLAHEFGHILEAEERSWRYLPWIAWCFLRYGYGKSPTELRATAYADAHVGEFTNIGPVPAGVV